MYNNKNATAHENEEPEKVTTGLGLNQVKARLNILYPDMHKLEINETEDTFGVKLLIYGKVPE